MSLEHVLYTDEDENKPRQILDRNGDVVLSLCKVCGRGEADLEGPCPGYYRPRLFGVGA